MRRFIVVALSFILGACMTADAAQFATIGEPMPEYAAPTLAGDTLMLSELRGEVVLLNIWATWCPPCRDEMPELQRLQEQLGPEGLRVVGVSIDQPGAAAELRSFLADHEIGFTVLHDAEGRVTRLFRTTGVPETFLIDREGRLVKRWIGRIYPESESVRGPVLQALRTVPATK